jgi:pimeloyl-ACP methyl ester carboxylesterase
MQRRQFIEHVAGAVASATLSGCVGHGEHPSVGVTPLLRRSRVPVRIVWGTADTVFSAASPDWLDHTVPHSRGVRRVEGAKAFFPEEMPDVIAAESRALWGIGP